MNRTEKEAFIAEFSEKIGKTSVVYLTDFSGLDVKAITVLRQNLKDVGAEFFVVKNRLVRRAIAEAEGFPDLGDSLLGPTGIVFGYGGAVEPAKAVSEFAKQHDDRPVFKIGVLDDQIVDAAQIERLAKLPSKDELMAELAWTLQAPIAALAAALGGKVQEMAGMIEALKVKQGGEG